MDMVRERIATFAMTSARSLGRSLGCEPVVELNEHSIDIGMEVPNQKDRAWDGTMYKRGNVYVKGYANPVKPKVNYNPELDNPDEVDVSESDGEGNHVQLISSARYRQYMYQNLIEQMINPREQWKTMIYLLLGMAGLQFIGIIITLFATGSF